jgi:hypothetical protein
VVQSEFCMCEWGGRFCFLALGYPVESLFRALDLCHWWVGPCPTFDSYGWRAVFPVREAGLGAV